MPGFASLGALWLLLLIPPLVIFYFLKLRRPHVPVPSLVLWRQVLDDQRVNSPFQRFKRNILLLLQLLLLILLILAAAQPFFQGSVGDQYRLPIIIDVSASMAARDPAGRSRLDLAKDRVRQIINDLSDNQSVSLIAVGHTGRRLVGFTNNKRILREALDTLAVQDVPSGIEDALRMTEAMARRESFKRVVLLTDGNLPARSGLSEQNRVAEVNFALPFDLDFEKLPAAGSNLGFTAVTARRAAEDRWDLLVNVERSTDDDAAARTGVVELWQDGERQTVEDVSLLPGRSQRMLFRLAASEATRIELRLIVEGHDALVSDNTAWLNLKPPRPLFVYVAPSLTTVRAVISRMPGINLYPTDGDRTLSSYDLVISDDTADEAIAAVCSMFIGRVPEPLRPLVTLAEEGGRIIDWQRINPLLQYVELTGVLMMDEPRWAEGGRVEEVEREGFEVIAHGRVGPMILQRQAGGTMQYWVLFHVDRSTLPYRVGFPIILANLVEQTQRLAGLAEVRGPTTGVLPDLALEPAKDYTIEGPAGHRATQRSDSEGLLAAAAAPLVGQYRIQHAGGPTEVGVSLLNPTETSLASVDRILFNEASVEAATRTVDVDKPLWPWLAAAGLVVLLLEWWVYQRKPGGFNA